MRHNDLRDFTANLLTEVCPNVCIALQVGHKTSAFGIHEADMLVVTAFFG